MGYERGREVRRKGWALPLLFGTSLLLLAAQRELRPPPPPPRPPRPAPARPGEPPRVGPVELAGPDGARATLPRPGGPTVVHVWLQGCPDCAPAFEAARRLGLGQARFGVPVVNVAFQGVEPAYARAHGLDEGLVVDGGGAVVSPLGIGTFTTLVLDARGFVRLAAHPQDPGYLEDVTTAVVQAATPLPLPVEAPAPPAPAPAPRRPGPDPATLALGGGGALLVTLGALWALALVPWGRLGPAAPAPPRALGSELGLQGGQRCPYCHAGLGPWDWAVRCGGCQAAYHDDCARELGTCSALGCGRPVADPRTRTRP